MCGSLLGAEPTCVFRVDSLSVSLRLPLNEGQHRPDYRLSFVADLPRGGSLLRLSNLNFDVVQTDTGERLGLLLRPANRTQTPALDRQVQRDQTLRLNVDVTPPYAAVRRLIGISGTAQICVGSGDPRTQVVAVVAQKSVAISGLDHVSVTIEEATAKQTAMFVPSELLERFSGATFNDAAGLAIVVKSIRSEVKEHGSRVIYDIDGGPATSARLVWYPQTRSETVAIAIPILDIPGGIPGIGDATATPPPRPASPKPAKWKQPLHVAIEQGDEDAVARLLETKGAELEKVEIDGRRPLQRAVALGRSGITERLLTAGADIGVRMRDGGLTVLDLAVGAGDAVLTELLLVHHADPNLAVPSTGWTPLHQAVHADAPTVVRMLLEAHADPWLQDKAGRSAADLARDEGRWVILRQLLGNPDPPHK